MISGKRPVAAKTIDAAEMAGGAEGEDGAGAQSECRFRKRNLSLALAASGEGIANLCRMCCSSRIRASVNMPLQGWGTARAQSAFGCRRLAALSAIGRTTTPLDCGFLLLNGQLAAPKEIQCFYLTHDGEPSAIRF